MSQDPHTPSLPDALRTLIGDAVGGVRVAIPGRVESYDAATARATVQPLVREAYFDEYGERQLERLPAIPDVPVLFPGAGAYQIDFPVAAGDVVLLVMASSTLDRWLQVGGEADPSDGSPGGGLSDAVAIPGLRDFAHPYAGPASKRIKFTPTQIQAGGSAALATKADLDALASWIHTTMATLDSDGDTSSGTTNTPPAAAGTTVLRGA